MRFARLVCPCCHHFWRNTLVFLTHLCSTIRSFLEEALISLLDLTSTHYVGFRMAGGCLSSAALALAFGLMNLQWSHSTTAVQDHDQCIAMLHVRHQMVL
jgi:hypothetical protein